MFFSCTVCHAAEHDAEVIGVDAGIRPDDDSALGKITVPAFTPSAPSEINHLRATCDGLCNVYAFLKEEQHYLHKGIVGVERALEERDGSRAADMLTRIEQEVQMEEDQLAVAFEMFKKPGKDHLTSKEVQTMLRYLGYPYRKNDVEQVMKAVDTDGDNNMGLLEFQMYVGRMGGSYKLFALRKKTRMVGPGGRIAEDIREALLECGVADSQQAFWRMVMPKSELEAVTKLIPCQRSAIRHIRAMAKNNHEAKLWKLQIRVRQMGYDDMALWKTLAFIREHAPIIVHINIDRLLAFIEGDTHYRNQFETASSGGLLSTDVRLKWERDLFLGAYDVPECKPFDRCKYGVLNPQYDYRGVVSCTQYGDSYMVLKDARLRCTFSPVDSANLKADQLAVLDYYGHVLLKYTDRELRKTIDVACSDDPASMGDSSTIAPLKYKEAQIHGELCFREHVEKLVLNERHRMDVNYWLRCQDVCKKYGWEFSWMGEEKANLSKESKKHKLGPKAWAKRLDLLDPDAAAEREAAAAAAAAAAEKAAAEKAAAEAAEKAEAEKAAAERAVATAERATAEKDEAEKAAAEENAADANFAAEEPSAAEKAAAEEPSAAEETAAEAVVCLPCGAGEETTAAEEPSDAGANEDPPDMAVVPDGFCIRGCGRAVSAGLTRNGHKYVTCCKGCAMGFGHDLNCGSADFGEGKCKHGCGRPVNPGLTRAGNPYDTCCRGCVSGKHDFTCAALTNQADTNMAVSNQVPVVAIGMCRMGCDRPAAKSSDGRVFTTCCRGCASGYGHSRTCGKVVVQVSPSIPDDGPKPVAEIEKEKAEPEEIPGKAKAKARAKIEPAIADGSAATADPKDRPAKTRVKTKTKIEPAAADEPADTAVPKDRPAKAKVKAKAKSELAATDESAKTTDDKATGEKAKAKAKTKAKPKAR